MLGIFLEDFFGPLTRVDLSCPLRGMYVYLHWGVIQGQDLLLGLLRILVLLVRLGGSSEIISVLREELTLLDLL